ERAVEGQRRTGELNIEAARCARGRPREALVEARESALELSACDPGAGLFVVADEQIGHAAGAEAVVTVDSAVLEALVEDASGGRRDLSRRESRRGHGRCVGFRAAGADREAAVEAGPPVDGRRRSLVEGAGGGSTPVLAEIMGQTDAHDVQRRRDSGCLAAGGGEAGDRNGRVGDIVEIGLRARAGAGNGHALELRVAVLKLQRPAIENLALPTSTHGHAMGPESRIVEGWQGRVET